MKKKSPLELTPKETVPENYFTELKDEKFINKVTEVSKIIVAEVIPSPLQKRDLVCSKTKDAILAKFLMVKCPLHNSRYLDQVCLKEDCKNSRIFYCSICLIQEKEHVEQHKNYFVEIEKFLVSKVESISGSLTETRLINDIARLGDIKKLIDDRAKASLSSMQNDIESFIKDTTVYCNQLMSKLKERLDSQKRKLKLEIETLVKDMEVRLENHYNEGELFLRDFMQIVESVDLGNENQINSFLTKLKERENTFTNENFSKANEKEVDRKSKKIKNAEFYRSIELENLKESVLKSISDLIESPSIVELELKYDALIEDTEKDVLMKKNTNQRFYTTGGENKGADESQSFELGFEINNKAFIENNLWNFSLATTKLIQTDHNMALNSIDIFRRDQDTYLVTCGNDMMIKIWEDNPNFNFFLKAEIKLKELALTFKTLDSGNLIFVGSMLGDLIVYDAKNLKDIKLLRTIHAHSKLLRKITFIPHCHLLGTISYDRTIKFWSLSAILKGESTEKAKTDLDEDYRVVDVDEESRLVLGSTTGSLLVIKLEEIGGNRFEPEIKNKITAHKDKITSLMFSRNNPKVVFCGCKTGTISSWNIETGKLLKRIRLVKDCVYSLMLFERNSNPNKDTDEIDGYLCSFHWEQRINIIEAKKAAVVSTVYHVLKNDDTKHLNQECTTIFKQQKDAIWIISAGNDDRRLQLFEIKLINAPSK